jgi:hypothetical protein
MKELFDPAAVERIMLFLAIGGPLVGLIIGSMLGAHRRSSVPTIAAGTLLGALCSVAYGAWKLCNAITNALGLDSMANLALQLALFAVVGCILGVAALKLSALFHEFKSRNTG